jgi:hypothetical protein
MRALLFGCLLSAVASATEAPPEAVALPLPLSEDSGDPAPASQECPGPVFALVDPREVGDGW